LFKLLVETEHSEIEIDNIFPLHTLQSMAERWGLSRQAVYFRSTEHKDFPQPIEGIIEKTARTPNVYPLYEVRRYENARGLKK
jgi:hypothetical protein